MTTASLHREMVEALRKAHAALDEIASQDIDWSKGTADNVNLLQAMAEEALYGVVGALEGWEKRSRLRDTHELILAVFRLLAEQDAERRVDRSFADQVAHRTERAVAILDALEPLLFGERG